MDIIEPYKFCPFCGRKFASKDEDFLTCEENHRYYISPKPTTCIVLENLAGKILVAKRKIEPYQGFWDLPGGFVKPFESAEEGIRREIKEELG